MLSRVLLCSIHEGSHVCSQLSQCCRVSTLLAHLHAAGGFGLRGVGEHLGDLWTKDCVEHLSRGHA